MQTAQFQLHAEIEERHWWFVARRRIMRQIVREVLPPVARRPAVTVLDVGCGTGGNIAALAEDYRCVGIDTSAEAVALATQRFPRVEFVCGQAPKDVASLMPDVRMVLLMDVLEHVPDDVGLLGSLARAAVPGTYFLITVPADPRLWSGHDVAFGHYRRYEPQGLRGVWSNLPLASVLHFVLQRPAVSASEAGPHAQSLAGRDAGRGRHRFQSAQPRRSTGCSNGSSPASRAD